jgi:hypothetical protein
MVEVEVTEAAYAALLSLVMDSIIQRFGAARPIYPRVSAT